MSWTFPSADPLDRFLGQLVSVSERDAAASEVFLYGLPFDGAVLGRKGCARGPEALRQAARTLKACRADGTPLARRIFDMGDAALPPDDIEKAHEIAEARAREALLLAQGSRAGAKARVIALGGDHSLAFPCARPYLDRHGPAFAVVNLDAHLDIRQLPPGRPPNSGSGFGQLLDAGLKHYACIGARDFQTSQVYVERIRDVGGLVVSAGEVHSKGAEPVAREVLAGLSREVTCIYLSVDLDAADASVAPGVSAPTPGGLFAHQLFELVRAFAADPRTRAAGIFELAPNLEEPHSDRTARLGAGCLAEMVAFTNANKT